MRKIYLVFTALMMMAVPFAANAADTRNDVTPANSQRVQDNTIVNRDGTVVDRNGRVVNRDGRVVDQNGRVVDRDGRVMTQDGRVLNQDNKAAVQDATMNRLERQEDRQSTGEYLDDAGITAKVKAKFVGQKGLDSLDIKVVTVDGTVTLMGDVDNSAQIGLAESAAKEVQGVTKVDNKLMLKK